MWMPKFYKFSSEPITRQQETPHKPNVATWTSPSLPTWQILVPASPCPFPSPLPTTSMQRGLRTQPTPLPPTSPCPPATRAQTQALMDAKLPRTRSRVLDKQSLVEMSPTKKPAPHPYSHITKFGPPKGVKKNAPNGKSVSAMTDTALAILSKYQVAGGSISVKNRYVLNPCMSPLSTEVHGT